ncbi:Hydrogen peroxide-inducible genes activator [Pigmentiphaga humi]|uniref:Hydrogen peroxide-inducible genes activator n=1 Tax=Pigmentiphaga humi TaxID=2478468 RepID=A0A3P4B2H2_9BURK|nr:LysR family transcriptional regulator [Pigmentiphaga humi]VCU70081.1 Hydrogen peroxide-inducible genes activator [Pigmentiphaga humi]
MNFSHRQLKAFLVVARLRNFSRAAEQLHIAQSGLSLMIRELEGQLGFRLFDRTTRQVTLTRFGSAFLPVAEQNVSSVEDIVEQLGRSAQHAATALSVGAPPLTCSYLLPPVIAAFAQQYPGVRLHLVDTELSEVSSMVRGGQLDIGLGMFIKPAAGVIRKPLFNFSLVAASAAPRFQMARAPRAWNAFESARFIKLPFDNPLQQLIDKHLAQVGHSAPPAFVVNFIETQIGLAEAGRGIAILPSTAIPACKGRGIRLEQLAAPVIELDFYELRDRARELAPCADDFCNMMRKLLPRMVSPVRRG